MSMQGAIYELKNPDGNDSGQLLKVLKFKAVLPITGNDIGEEIRWQFWHISQPEYVHTPQSIFKCGGRFLSVKSALAGLKREWIIGQHLNKLRGPKGELQGTCLYARCLQLQCSTRRAWCQSQEMAHLWLMQASWALGRQ